MKFLRLVALAFTVLVLAGCAHDFVRPAPETLKVGHSTKDDVLKVAGNPTVKNDNIQLNGETIQTLTYFYVKGAKFYGMIAPQRTLTYSFFNNVLIGEEFNSSFDEESTNFEAEKAFGIVKGKSTKADVIAALGKPAGDVRYPIIKDKDGKGVVYEYTVSRHGGLMMITTQLVLVITLDANNVVSEVSYKKNGVEQIKS
jgi:outer membrane protein assembly factor BamE (lipoprotein component of BamABCDE complex)